MAPSDFFSASSGLSVLELAAGCGANLLQDEFAAETVTAIAPIGRAGRGEVAFVKSRKSIKDLERSKASAVICTQALAAHVPEGVAALVADRPEAAFALAASMLHPDAMRPLRLTGEAGISERALVDHGARLEPGVAVEAGAVIGAGAEIGSGTVILANATIGRGCKIGRDCTIGANASVQHAFVGNRVIIHTGARIGQDGFGYAAGARGLAKLPQVGRVVIQDDVEIGANSCIDRGAMDDTVIGEGTKIDNLVQIGHNVRIGRHCALAGMVGVAGSARIGDGVLIGGGTGINGHISIGDGAVIAGFSGVHDDVPAGVQWGGIPARPMRGVIRDGVEAIARAHGREKRRESGTSHERRG